STRLAGNKALCRNNPTRPPVRIRVIEDCDPQNCNPTWNRDAVSVLAVLSLPRTCSSASNCRCCQKRNMNRAATTIQRAGNLLQASRRRGERNGCCRCPNSLAERRECLDFVSPLNKRHLLQ